MTTPTTPEVKILGWNPQTAAALVGGVRVRVRRRRDGSWWMCDEHGRSADAQLCEHVSAFAATSVPNWPDGLTEDA